MFLLQVTPGHLQVHFAEQKCQRLAKLFKGSETDICLIVQRPIHVPRRQKGRYWVADECKMINTKIVELG